MTRRTACILLTAAVGDVRAAKAVFRSIATTVLGRGYRGEPWHCHYFRACDLEPGVSLRWTLEVTDAEFSSLVAAMAPAYQAAGWQGVPLDCYHD